MENEKAMEILSDFMNKLSLRLSLTKYNNDSSTSLFVLNRGYIKKLFEAINLGIAAVKTIDDGNFIYADTDSVYKMKTKLNSIYGKMASEIVDLKTLYENVTMYCDMVDNYRTIDYYVEVYRQPDTPILIFAYWKHNKLFSITHMIREDIKL